MVAPKDLIHSILGLQKLKHYDSECCKETNIFDASSKALELLKVTPEIIKGDLYQIPKTGSVIIAANHPFGGIEGVIIINLIAKIRQDFKIIVTKALKEIKMLEQFIIPVDVFKRCKSNPKAIREAQSCLNNGEVIIIFPAGEVSSYSIKSNLVADPHWHKTLGYLAKKTNTDIVPINFSGRNGALFQALGLIHPLLRTSILPREILNKQEQIIKLSVGKTIKISDWSSIKNSQQLTEFVKLSSYILDANSIIKPELNKSSQIAQSVSTMPDWSDIMQEISKDQSTRTLVRTDAYEVIVIDGNNIPNTIKAIGILREITFREINEGTGKSIDTDDFDHKYKHIILLNKELKRIAGAYRLFILSNKNSIKSYTETLIDFPNEFKDWLTPAAELGRAFVHPLEQKNNNCLGILWQGIFKFLSIHKLTKFFGTASIPANFSPLSRELILHYLAKNHMNDKNLGKISAKHKVKLQTKQWGELGINSLDSIKQINWLLEQIEPGSKFPGLIKHYLKLGCKCYKFSMDPNFSNVIDCLFVLDIKQQENLLIKRMIGKKAYENWMKNTYE